ncbi:cytochrome P450 [Mycena olivaceomarginata]|nr:cytochrome P450 [Mycena olivaceomarginata]
METPFDITLAPCRRASELELDFRQFQGHDGTDDLQLTDRWREEFGPTFKFKRMFSMSELHMSDLKALTHIVNNGTIYRRAPSTRSNTTMLVGKGLLSVDLEQHKHQRRMMTPAFGVAQIRLVTEIFVEKAVQLRDIWSRQIALGKKDSEQYTLALLVQSTIAVLRSLPAPWRANRNALTKMDVIANQIVMESKADAKLEGLAAKRDLVSVLIKANMSPGLLESQRLTHVEVIAQIPTFFVAGHETTSIATAWALHALSQHTTVQVKLRNKPLILSTDNPSMEELNSFPCLETVVREVMRFHAPVVFTQRMAMEDNVVPLSKPYIDKAGKSHDSPLGQMIHIPILAVNTDKEIWGEDARKFKPEHWENLPDTVGLVPGVRANLLTFFAGTTNCIGFRFSLIEHVSLSSLVCN